MNVDRAIVRVGNQDQTAVYKSFGAVFVASGTAGQSKTVVFPDGYNNDGNLAFKVVFPNGHNDGTNLDVLTLNGIAVVVNQNGSLVPIPHHAMTESNATVYKVLQPNTVLELYYTSDYDGNNTPAFVVIGNPVVLSSTDYTIYANGQKDNSVVNAVLLNNMNSVSSNAVYAEMVNWPSYPNAVSGYIYGDERPGYGTLTVHPFGNNNEHPICLLISTLTIPCNISTSPGQAANMLHGSVSFDGFVLLSGVVNIWQVGNTHLKTTYNTLSNIDNDTINIDFYMEDCFANLDIGVRFIVLASRV